MIQISILQKVTEVGDKEQLVVDLIKIPIYLFYHLQHVYVGIFLNFQICIFFNSISYQSTRQLECKKMSHFSQLIFFFFSEK